MPAEYYGHAVHPWVPWPPWAPLGTPQAPPGTPCRTGSTSRRVETARGAHFWNNTFRDMAPELVVWLALTPVSGIIRLGELFISQILRGCSGRQAGPAGPARLARADVLSDLAD